MSAGYSGTPLPRKLGIREGDTVALVDAPAGFEALLEPLPEGATLRRDLRARVPVSVCLVTSRAHLERRLPQLERATEEDGRIWIGWPKRSSGVPTDVTEDVVREVALPAGRLVDNKVAALDETWSGLQLVVRRERRGGDRSA